MILTELAKAVTTCAVFLLAGTLLGQALVIWYGLLPSPTPELKYIGAMASGGTFLMTAWMLGDLQHRFYCRHTEAL